MPLVIILFIGILSFGLFELTLGRPLPILAVRPPAHDALNSPPESAELPSVKAVATSQVAHCEAQDTACQSVALYRFVLTTVHPEPAQSPWHHAQQDPTRTLFRKTGDAADIAILFSSLLDQQHIRNYVIVLPRDSYVLACDISPTALHHAGGKWQPATPAFDPHQITVANDPTTTHPTERIDAYALNVVDAPCPCILLDPSEPIDQQPGAPLPVPPEVFRAAIDLTGQRHALVHSGL